MNGPSYPADYGTDGRNGGHCGVLAVAMAAGVSFEAAWDALKRIGKKPHNWKGSTRPHERAEALKGFGVRFAEQRLVSASLISGLCPAYVEAMGYGPRCTVATFATRKAKPGVTYMVRVRGHVVTVRDGMIADQTGIHPAAKHRSARCHANMITEILQ